MSVGAIFKVQVIVYSRTPEIRVLLLQRPPEREGVWQPVTGKMEPDDPHYIHAARRELKEETGITEVLHLVETGVQFRFTKESRQVREYLVGAEVERAQPVRLSHEHMGFAWLEPAEAASRLYWDIHREGLASVLLAVR